MAGRKLFDTLSQALASFRTGWAKLAETDLLFKAIAVAVFSPLIGLLFKFLIARTGGSALADVDIALFFFTTRPGVVALIFVSGLALAVAGLEQACLMTLGLGIERGAHLRVRDAFAHAAARAFSIVRVTSLLVLRLLFLVLPFAVAGALTYTLLLRRYDINFYLSQRPPEFFAAAVIVGAIVAALGYVLVRYAAAWVLVLPIVVFERGLPFRAFAESGRRIEGRRAAAAGAITLWAVVTLAVSTLATHGLLLLGRTMAPWFAGSMAGLFSFIGLAAGLWLVVTVAVGIAANSIFALIIVRLYVDAGLPEGLRLPKAFDDRLEIEGRQWRITWPMLLGGIVTTMVVLGVASRFLMTATWTDRPVLVIAHRGASADAPENTMAAFRAAVEQHTDMVELDVQETADGIVIVIHDSDLMKVGRSPLKVWESSFETLRAVDVGSFFSRDFASERLPTLEEALALCKGVSRVDIELKDYGHDQRLEERVVELVEAAGMQDHIVTMSLSRKMVERMKSLRPKWSSGLLLAKTIGDPSGLPVDFLAVQSKVATRRFVRTAHAANKPVYVWTVDDPDQMIRFIGLGVDGLITNRPALTRAVVARYQAMSPPERLLMFLMTRLGGHQGSSDLRP